MNRRSMNPTSPKFRALGLLSAALLGLACNERLVDTDQIPVEPYCLIAAGTSGTLADGTSYFLLYDGDHGGTLYVCSCITEEQFWDEAQLARVEDELNDRLLVECESVAEQAGYVSNDCQLHHDIDYWTAVTRFAIGNYELYFSCEGEGWIEPPICELGEPGCSCTVEAVCTDGTTCIDGMCQPPP